MHFSATFEHTHTDTHNNATPTQNCGKPLADADAPLSRGVVLALIFGSNSVQNWRRTFYTARIIKQLCHHQWSSAAALICSSCKFQFMVAQLDWFMTDFLPHFKPLAKWRVAVTVAFWFSTAFGTLLAIKITHIKP